MERHLTSPAALPRSQPVPRDSSQRLLPRATLSVRLRAGARITVSAGRLWLTRANDLDDYFIAAGQQHVVGAAGRVLLECDSDMPARFRIESR